MITMIQTDHVQKFLECLKWEERSAGTIEKYKRDVKAFYSWIQERELEREVVLEWKSELLSRGYAAVTINSMLSAVNGFLRFLGREDCRMKYLKIQRKIFRDPKKELTRAEYESLLSAARTCGKDRLFLLMETICASGIRVSEVRYITVETETRGQAVIELKGKIRTILLPRKLCRKLLKYVKNKKSLPVRYSSPKAEAVYQENRFGQR